MQRQAQLDDAQVRRKVGTAAANEIAQHFAHLGRQPLELRQRKLAQDRAGEWIVGRIGG